MLWVAVCMVVRPRGRFQHNETSQEFPRPRNRRRLIFCVQEIPPAWLSFDGLQPPVLFTSVVRGPASCSSACLLVCLSCLTNCLMCCRTAVLLSPPLPPHAPNVPPSHAVPMSTTRLHVLRSPVGERAVHARSPNRQQDQHQHRPHPSHAAQVRTSCAFALCASRRRRTCCFLMVVDSGPIFSACMIPCVCWRCGWGCDV